MTDPTTNTGPSSNTNTVNPATTASDATSITMNSGSSTAGIAIGVVFAILAIIAIVVIIIVVILVCLRRPKGNKFHNSIRRGLGTDTLEKTEMDTKPQYNAHSMKPPADLEEDQYDQIGEIRQERASNRPVNMDEAQESSHVEQSCMPSAGKLPSASETGNPMCSASQVYAVVDKSKRRKPPQQPVQQKPPQQPVEQMYAVVDKPKRRKPPQQPVQQEYAVVDKSKPLQQSVEQMYAVVDKPKHRKPLQQPVQQKPPQQPVEQMYAVVDKPKSRKPPSQPAIPEYATTDQMSSPELPTKSDDFLKDLEASTI